MSVPLIIGEGRQGDPGTPPFRYPALPVHTPSLASFSLYAFPLQSITQYGDFSLFPYVNGYVISVPDPDGGRGGGVLCKFLGGVCRWDSETLNLFKTILAAFCTRIVARLNTEKPFHILDLNYIYEQFLCY